MPEFDLDSALEVSGTIPTGTFTNYRYARPDSRDWAHCAHVMGRHPFLMGMVCDDTEDVIIQLLSGRYFTVYGAEEYESAVFEDAIQWLRQHHQEEEHHA